MERFGRKAAGRLRHVQHLVCILFGREARDGTAVFPGQCIGSLRKAICLLPADEVPVDATHAKFTTTQGRKTL